MTVNFNELLTVEQKQVILSQKINQLAAEGYQLQINRGVLLETPDSEIQLAQTDQHIEMVSKAIIAYQAELDTLN